MLLLHRCLASAVQSLTTSCCFFPSCVLRVQINKSSMDSTDDAERGRAQLMPPPKGSLPSPKAARRDTSSGGVAGASGGGGGGTEYSSGKLTQAATRR